jgi:MoaA/NifB/PqqE/SkfB family radical SAM enzyme
MSDIIKVEQRTDSPFYITWIINNICTNQCSYCPTVLHTGKNHNYEWDNARRFFDILFEKYGKVFCSIAGGEPSVSPFLPEIVKTFHKNGSGVNITTNGAKTVEYWSELSPYISSLVFSWHPQFVDPKFLEKVLSASKNTRVVVRIMMYKEYWQQAVNAFYMYKDIKDIDLVTPVKIYEWGGNVDQESHVYEDYQLDWFEKNSSVSRYNKCINTVLPGTDLKFYFKDGSIIANPNVIDYINQGQTNFKNYICEVGIKHLYVDWKGDIYRANCRIGGVIGNINNPKAIKWPEGNILCNQELCTCSTDVVINKSIFKLSLQKK